MEKPWHSAARSEVKLLAQQGELYVLAESHDRIAKERWDTGYIRSRRDSHRAVCWRNSLRCK